MDVKPTEGGMVHLFVQSTWMVSQFREHGMQELETAEEVGGAARVLFSVTAVLTLVIVGSHAGSRHLPRS